MCDSKVKVAPLQMIFVYDAASLSVCILWNFLCTSSATLLLLFVGGAKVVIVLSFPLRGTCRSSDAADDSQPQSRRPEADGG